MHHAVDPAELQADMPGGHMVPRRIGLAVLSGEIPLGLIRRKREILLGKYSWGNTPGSDGFVATI